MVQLKHMEPPPCMSSHHPPLDIPYGGHTGNDVSPVQGLPNIHPEIMVACALMQDEKGADKFVLVRWPNGQLVHNMAEPTSSANSISASSDHDSTENKLVKAMSFPWFSRKKPSEPIPPKTPLPKPPTNAVTLRTYWWGYELYFPESCMRRIDQAATSAQAVVGFLQTIAIIAPVIYPFIGIVAAYVQLEYTVIKSQDQGQGVILAAVWPLPVVFFPRPWDVVPDPSPAHPTSPLPANPPSSVPPILISPIANGPSVSVMEVASAAPSAANVIPAAIEPIPSQVQ